MTTENKESKKTLKTLALASFLNDVGAEMIYPVWPFFVTHVLKANMSVLGLIDGLGDAVVSLSQAFSGYWSDRLRKRKVFIWTGYLCGSISRIGYALAGSWLMLIPCRILDRAGKIRAAPRDAMIADLSHGKNRGENFGIVRMADYLGGVVGIVFCILFIQLLGYQKLFMIAAIPSIVGVIILIAIIKDSPHPHASKYRAISLAEIDVNLRLFFFLSALFALATFSYSFLLIIAQKVGFSIAVIPLLYLAYNIIAGVCTIPFGKLSDRLGRKKVMLISFLLWAIVCGVLMYALNWITVCIALFFYGMHKGAFEVVQKAFAAELSPKDFRASCMGYYQMIIGICALPASVIAGFLWDRVGTFSALSFSLVLTIFASALLCLVKENEDSEIITRRFLR